MRRLLRTFEIECSALDLIYDEIQKLEYRNFFRFEPCIAAQKELEEITQES